MDGDAVGAAGGGGAGAASGPPGGARRGPGRGALLGGLAAAAVAAAFLAGYALGPGPGGGEAPAAALQVQAGGGPVKGDPGAPVRIIEYSDFQCPFCARFYRDTLPQIERDYIDAGIASLEYRDLPLPIHANAVPAHVAARCAGEQGAFWEYHDVLFERAGEWGRLGPGGIGDRLASYARELGLGEGFAACAASPEALRAVREDAALGAALGVTGTPTFFVGSDGGGYAALVGAQPYEAFRAAIDAAAG